MRTHTIDVLYMFLYTPVMQRLCRHLLHTLPLGRDESDEEGRCGRSHSGGREGRDPNGDAQTNGQDKENDDDVWYDEEDYHSR